MADSKYQIGVDISATGAKELAKEFEAIAPAVENTRKAFVQLPKDIDRASKSMENVATPTQKASGAFVQLPPNVERAAKAFKDLAAPAKQSQEAVSELPKAVKSANEQIKQVPKGSAQASSALTNLGRVAQDAPFGFIGIQNNIGPLIDSFGYLQKSTGSTGAALKALGSSLVGPAGIGLGIAVVTGLVTAAIQKYGSLGNAINVVFGLTSNLEQANRDLAKSFAESEGSVAGEVASVQALVNIAQNKALSDATRQQALDKLNKEYDTYLPKLTLENINTQKVTESVNKLTNSLVRQAKIRGVEDLISKAAGKQAQLLANDITDNLSLFDEFVAAIKSGATGVTLAQGRLIEAANLTGKEYAKAGVQVERYTQVLNELTKEEAVAGTLVTTDKDPKEKKAREEKIDQLQKQIDALNKVRTAQKATVEEQVKGYQDAKSAADALVATEQQLFDLRVKVTLRDAKKNGLDKGEVSDLIDSYKKQLSEAFKIQATVREGTVKLAPRDIVAIVDITSEEVNSKIAKALGIDKDIKLPVNGTVQLQGVGLDARNRIEILDQMRKDLENKLKSQDIDGSLFFKGLSGAKNEKAAQLAADQIAAEFEVAINNAIGKISIDAIASLGEGIANVFSGEGLKGLVTPFLSVLANALTELGKAAISYGVAMEAIQKALRVAFKNPFIAIAAGLAAVAAGSLLKNKISKSSGRFEGGGIATGPSSGYQVTLHGTEAIVPLKNNRYPFGVGGGSQSQELFAVIRGKDLYLSNQRTSNSRRRI